MPMSRNTGMPSDSMKLSYGVFGRPNLPKPARLPPVGSCQWVAPGTSCMSLFLFFDFCRLLVLLGGVSLVHRGLEPVPGKLALDLLARLRVLVGIVDLVAAEPLADP